MVSSVLVKAAPVFSLGEDELSFIKVLFDIVSGKEGI